MLRLFGGLCANNIYASLSSFPKLPCIVKTRFVSARAEEKIKEAGGVVKLIA